MTKVMMLVAHLKEERKVGVLFEVIGHEELSLATWWMRASVFTPPEG